MHIRSFGDQLGLVLDDGTTILAYPTQGGLWMFANTGSEHGGGDPDPGPGPDPDPGSNLTNYYGTPGYGWEAHASYSRGGTDWPFGMRTPIRAPAAGTIVNYGNIDGAGLKSMLVFDAPHARTLPASTTLMNGVYYENPTADAVAFMIQHLDSQVPAGHYAKGATIGYSGNTAGPGRYGDVHLHAHLLAGTSVGSDRLDFMKFL